MTEKELTIMALESYCRVVHQSCLSAQQDKICEGLSCQECPIRKERQRAKDLNNE